jgi:phosphoribosylamine--glycine ligase
MVVKADGLAAGKGVLICESRDAALNAVDLMMGDEAVFGASGSTIIVEEFLRGREVSAHAFCDGKTVAPMPFACDYKRAKDGDVGLNTGGMGAYTPAFWLDEAHESFIRQGVTEATVRAMAELGAPYSGALYPGIIVTDGGPQVLEFNCRIGDPEAQVLLPRLKSDLLGVCMAAVEQRLDEIEVEWSPDAYVGVVMASGGYPEAYETGFEVAGLNSLDGDVLVFHAGTALGEDGSVVTSGGRVITVVAGARTLADARAKVYRNVQRIHFSKAYYRSDIAAPAQNARVD